MTERRRTFSSRLFSKASKSTNPSLSTAMVSTVNPSRTASARAAPRTHLCSIALTRIRRRSRGARRARPSKARLFGFGSAGGEDHFVGVGSYQRRYGRGRFLNRPVGLPPDGMVAGVGIAKRTVPKRGHFFQDQWINRGGRLVIRIYGLSVLHANLACYAFGILFASGEIMRCHFVPMSYFYLKQTVMSVFPVLVQGRISTLAGAAAVNC